VEDEDGIRKDGKLVRKLNGRGTTSRGQARRLAKYVLYSNKLEREIVNFKAGLEALMVNVGDIIEISDELKQFKIDGARVLQVNPGDPSIVIENTIDINSIDNEAFVYAPSGQTGKAEMYDEIRKGGLITNERLSGMDAQQVDKLQISSAVAEGDNGIKLNFTNVSGQSMSLIRTGSFANINLTNNESQTFRVIKIVPDDEQDIYSVMATEYNSGKFNFIEGNDENFNLSETTPFNIGIPDHTIKELTEPNSFSFTQTQNHIGTFDLNFTINGELNGNEEVYLISVVYPNGIRKEKRVKKSDETSGGYFVTETSFRNLEVFGTYNVFVKSDS
jgi:predicted phage tail protein